MITGILQIDEEYKDAIIVKPEKFKSDCNFCLVRSDLKLLLKEYDINKLPEIIYLMTPIVARSKTDEFGINNIDILMSLPGKDNFFIPLNEYKIMETNIIQDKLKNINESVGIMGKYREKLPAPIDLQFYKPFTKAFIKYLYDIVIDGEFRTPEDNAAIISQFSNLRAAKDKEITVTRATEILQLFHYSITDFLNNAYKYTD